MKARTILAPLLAGALLLPAWRHAEGQEASFLKGNETLSSPVAFLLSDRGRELLRHSPSPLAIEALRLFHGEESTLAPADPAEEVSRESPAPLDPGIVSPICGAPVGTKFNLEGLLNAISQDEEAVDYLRNRGLANADLVVAGANDFRGIVPVPFQSTLGSSVTGYYVNRTADCSPDFEGGLPPLTIPSTPLPVSRPPGCPLLAASAGEATRSWQPIPLGARFSSPTFGLTRRPRPSASSGTPPRT